MAARCTDTPTGKVAWALASLGSRSPDRPLSNSWTTLRSMTVVLAGSHSHRVVAWISVRLILETSHSRFRWQVLSRIANADQKAWRIS